VSCDQREYFYSLVVLISTIPRRPYCKTESICKSALAQIVMMLQRTCRWRNWQPGVTRPRHHGQLQLVVWLSKYGTMSSRCTCCRWSGTISRSSATYRRPEGCHWSTVWSSARVWFLLLIVFLISQDSLQRSTLFLN